MQYSETGVLRHRQRSANDSGHLVSRQEELTARAVERERAREEKEDDKTAQSILAGDYDDIKTDARLWRLRLLSNKPSEGSPEFVRSLALSINRKRELAIQEIARVESDVKNHGTDLKFDPKRAVALTEEVTVGGHPLNAIKRDDVMCGRVTVADKEFVFTEGDLLGTGGFGNVYLGHRVVEAGDGYDDVGEIVDSVLDIQVEDLDPSVIKIIDHSLYQTEAVDDLIRFEIAGIDSVGSLVGAKQYNSETHPTATVIVMERAEGKDMKMLKRENSNELKTPEGHLILASAMLSTARDLSRLHKAGIAHRDIKPSNIMLPVDRPEDARIIDYGLLHKVEGVGDVADEFFIDGQAVAGTTMFLTYGVLTGENGAFFDSDVSALGKSFGFLFDGDDFLSCKEKDDKRIMYVIMNGTLFKSPDLRNENVRLNYFARMEFKPEQEFAQLLYDIVLPHDPGALRERKRVAGQLLTLDDVIVKLETIEHDMKIVMRARRVESAALSGETDDAVSGDQLERLEHLLNNNSISDDSNIVELEKELRSIGKFRQEKPSPRSVRAELLGRKLDFIVKDWKEWTVDFGPELTPYMKTLERNIDTLIERMGVDIVRGDLDSAKSDHDQIAEIMGYLNQEVAGKRYIEAMGTDAVDDQNKNEVA